MEYKVICMPDIKELEQKVNTLLKDGWQVIGGVKIAPSNIGYCRYVQSMIKE